MPAGMAQLMMQGQAAMAAAAAKAKAQGGAQPLQGEALEAMQNRVKTTQHRQVDSRTVIGPAIGPAACGRAETTPSTGLCRRRFVFLLPVGTCCLQGLRDCGLFF